MCSKYWLVGVSSSWMLVAHVYRSYWAYGSVVNPDKSELTYDRMEE